MNAASNSAPTGAPPPDPDAGHGLSLRALNLRAAAVGSAPIYKESDLAAPAMAEARRAITLILSRQEPFPAFVTDSRWDLLAANDAGRRLLALMLGESRLAGPLNYLRLFLAPDGLRPHIVNWPAVAATMLRQARRATRAAPADLALQNLLRELLADPEVEAALALAPPDGPLCEVRLGSQGREIGLIGVSSTFAAPLDVTLDELRLECFLPADAESEDILAGMSGLAGLPMTALS